MDVWSSDGDCGDWFGGGNIFYRIAVQRSLSTISPKFRDDA